MHRNTREWNHDFLGIFLLFCLLLVLHSTTPCPAQDLAGPSPQGENGLSRHPWQIGVFAQGGFPPSYEVRFGFVHYGEQLELFSAGFSAGIQTRRFDGPRPLRGRGEALLEVVPFWLARYPPQTLVTYEGPYVVTGTWNGQNTPGASVTPFLLRWNFSQRDSARVAPWLQLGGGLLWTNHKFPMAYGDTSVINFTPQVGAGINVFSRPRHSMDFAIKAVHISNANLGDFDPGIFTLQFSAGYSWWK